MNVVTLAVLTKARDILKQGWTQGIYARTSLGSATHPASSDACKWCISGALRRATHNFALIEGEPLPPEYHEAYSSLQKECPDPDLVAWNDAPRRSKREILELLDRTISHSENMT